MYTGACFDVADYGRTEPQLVRVVQLDYKSPVISQRNPIRTNTVSVRDPESGSGQDIGTAHTERLPSPGLAEVDEPWAPHRYRVAPDSDDTAATARHMSRG